MATDGGRQQTVADSNGRQRTVADVGRLKQRQMAAGGGGICTW